VDIGSILLCALFAENHRLQSAYDNYLITKLVVVSIVFDADSSFILLTTESGPSVL